jgi:phosphatidate cytidylyltransferase
MRKRVLTSIVYVAAVLVLTLASAFTTMLMCAALSGLCAFELYVMLRSDAKLPNEMIGIVTAAMSPAAYYWWHFNGLLTLTVASATVLLTWYVIYAPARFSDVALTLFGSCYTGLLLASLVGIREMLPGFWGGALVFGVIVSVWANDAFAFGFGSRFGRHKLAPRISPNKSYEGFFAGIVGSVAVWCLLSLLPGLQLGLSQAALGGLLTGIMGILGDLVESRIKRSTGHKDSGSLLPGHGGFLDRCDSMLVAVAVASLYFRVLGML